MKKIIPATTCVNGNKNPVEKTCLLIRQKLLHPDSRIENAVDDIHNNIYDNKKSSKHQRGSHYNGQIVFGERFKNFVAYSFPAENNFHKNSSGHQARKPSRYSGNNR